MSRSWRHTWLGFLPRLRLRLHKTIFYFYTTIKLASGININLSESFSFLLMHKAIAFNSLHLHSCNSHQFQNLRTETIWNLPVQRSSMALVVPLYQTCAQDTFIDLIPCFLNLMTLDTLAFALIFCLVFSHHCLAH